MSAVWIFAYGSLLWDPGFTPVQIKPARLLGWQREFCMRSLHFRGTPEAPGLVLALDAAPHTYCDGLVLQMPQETLEADLATLRARELISNAYHERCLRVDTADGPLDALTYVMNHDSPQYCRLDLSSQAEIIAHAKGQRGPNREYLFNTLDRLAQLQITDADLTRLGQEVRQRIA